MPSLHVTDCWNSKFLAGEMLHVAEAFIDKKYHPTVICRGIFFMMFILSCWVCINFNIDLRSFAFAAYNKALEDALAVLDKISMSIDVNDRKLHNCSLFLHLINIHAYSFTGIGVFKSHNGRLGFNSRPPLCNNNIESRNFQLFIRIYNFF